MLSEAASAGMFMHHTSNTGRKLHIGCGHIILDGYVNVERFQLPGVDLVHDLTDFPWPFHDETFDEVIMVDVLEHLPDVVRTMEEIYRITSAGGRVTIRVPYYNAWDASFDPTHEHIFNENSFEFFDPSTDTGSTRRYYTRAAFQISCVGYLVQPGGKSFLLCDSRIAPEEVKLPSVYAKPIIRSSMLKHVYTKLGHKIGNVIRTLHIELIRR